MNKNGRFLPFARVILLTAGTTCLMVLAYFLYQYAWTGQREFTRWLGVATSYVLPAITALFLFCSLRLRSELQVTIAIGCLTVGVAAYGTEFYLASAPKNASMRMIWNAPPSDREAIATRLTKEFGVHIDMRNPLEVITDFKKQGIEAIPQVNLPLHVLGGDNAADVLPLSGMAGVVTVVGNESGQYVTYKSDEHGFHNASGTWRANPVDFVAVGNSLTLGCCVPSEQSFVGIIQKTYPAILNLGMTGAGPLHILGQLKEYAALIKPKAVLWFYSEETSLVELQSEKQSPILGNYLGPNFTQSLVKRQASVDRAVAGQLHRQNALEQESSQPVKSKDDFEMTRRLRGFIRLSALRQNLGAVYGTPTESALPAEEKADLQANIDLLQDIFEVAKTTVSGWGGKLYFVYIPNPRRYVEISGGGGQERLHVERLQVLQLAGALGFSVIDLLPVFESERDSLSLFPFRSPGHYNDKGHRLIAETVLKAI